MRVSSLHAWCITPNVPGRPTLSSTTARRLRARRHASVRTDRRRACCASFVQHRDVLEPQDLVELSVRRAYSLYLVNQFEAALECAESAVEAAEASGDPV